MSLAGLILLSQYFIYFYHKAASEKLLIFDIDIVCEATTECVLPVVTFI